MADWDVMITDFLGQLRAAEAEGWDRTRPHHHRAIVAALEEAMALERRRVAGPAAGDLAEGPAVAAAGMDGRLARLLGWLVSGPGLSSG
jgi:hypothetical protein